MIGYILFVLVLIPITILGGYYGIIIGLKLRKAFTLRHIQKSSINTAFLPLSEITRNEKDLLLTSNVDIDLFMTEKSKHPSNEAKMNIKGKCFRCLSPLSSNKAPLGYESNYYPSKCIGCSKLIGYRSIAAYNTSITVFDHTKSLLYCNDCYNRVYYEQANPCGYCYICAVCSDACNILTIETYEGDRIVYTACNAEHYEKIRKEVEEEREGECQNCNITYPLNYKVYISYYKEADPSLWFNGYSWLSFITGKPVFIYTRDLIEFNGKDMIEK